MLKTHVLALAVSLAAAHVFPTHAHGQKPPTRTAYKCVAGGKTTYSDAPCLAAVVVDTTPTRGLDKSTGIVRKGADVHREEFREQLAAGVRPITGMTAEQFNTAGRRQKLAPSARLECTALDGTLRTERDPAKLLAARQRSRHLTC